MPLGGQPQELASRFKGLNRLIAPWLLDPSESPDTSDCGGDTTGQIGPRKGRKRVFNTSFNIRGVVPLNLSYARYRLVATSNGTITPYAVPWPAGPVAPTGGPALCLQDFNNQLSNTTGLSYAGTATGMRVFIAVQRNNAASASLTGGLGLQLDPGVGPGSTGPNSDGVGWLDSAGVLGDLHQLQLTSNTFCDLYASPDGTMIQGYLGQGQWKIQTFVGGGNFKYVIGCVDDTDIGAGVGLSFTAGSLGGPVTTVLSRGASFSSDQTQSLIVVH